MDNVASAIHIFKYGSIPFSHTIDKVASAIHKCNRLDGTAGEQSTIDNNNVPIEKVLHTVGEQNGIEDNITPTDTHSCIAAERSTIDNNNLPIDNNNLPIDNNNLRIDNNNLPIDGRLIATRECYATNKTLDTTADRLTVDDDNLPLEKLSNITGEHSAMDLALEQHALGETSLTRQHSSNGGEGKTH